MGNSGTGIPVRRHGPGAVTQATRHGHSTRRLSYLLTGSLRPVFQLPWWPKHLTRSPESARTWSQACWQLQA